MSFLLHSALLNDSMWRKKWIQICCDVCYYHSVSRKSLTYIFVKLLLYAHCTLYLLFVFDYAYNNICLVIMYYNIYNLLLVLLLSPKMNNLTCLLHLKLVYRTYNIYHSATVITKHLMNKKFYFIYWYCIPTKYLCLIFNTNLNVLL